MILTAIDNIVVDHVLPGGSSLLFIDPRGLEPLVLGYQTKLDFRVSERSDTPRRTSQDRSDAIAIQSHTLFELLGERFFIQEDIGILEVLIETVL